MDRYLVRDRVKVQVQCRVVEASRFHPLISFELPRVSFNFHQFAYCDGRCKHSIFQRFRNTQNHSGKNKYMLEEIRDMHLNHKYPILETFSILLSKTQ